MEISTKRGNGGNKKKKGDTNLKNMQKRNDKKEE